MSPTLPCSSSSSAMVRLCHTHPPHLHLIPPDVHAGTVISVHPTPSLEFTASITERLHRDDSVLRTSEDASILVESLLDLGEHKYFLRLSSDVLVFIWASRGSRAGDNGRVPG